MLHPPGFYYVKKPKRFVILSSDKSSERNLSWFFDIIKPRRMEHLQSEEPFSSDPYFSIPFFLGFLLSPPKLVDNSFLKAWVLDRLSAKLISGSPSPRITQFPLARFPLTRILACVRASGKIPY